MKLCDLDIRQNIYYEKSTEVPFTGKVTGKEVGSLENGKMNGCWKRYYKNGQLSDKGKYKAAKIHGLWEEYDGAGE